MKSPDTRILTEAEVLGMKKGLLGKRVVINFPGLRNQLVVSPRRFSGSEIDPPASHDKFVLRIDKNKGPRASDIRKSNIKRGVYPT